MTESSDSLTAKSTDRPFALKFVKILDKALVAFGGKLGRDVKFILKDLAKEEHYTMTIFVKDRRFLVFDFHLTHEGEVKEYEPIVRLEYEGVRRHDRVNLGPLDSLVTVEAYLRSPFFAGTVGLSIERESTFATPSEYPLASRASITRFHVPFSLHFLCLPQTDLCEPYGRDMSITCTLW